IALPPFATARVGRLWCASSQMYTGVLAKINDRHRWEYFLPSPARFAGIIGEMVRRVEARTAIPTGQDRIFLARKGSLRRQLVNNAAIEAAAGARGFVVIYPEELDFAEQIR